MELAYVGVEVADRPGVNAVLRDIVGLVPGPDTLDAAATWRDDHKVHRVIISDGPADDARFMGIELAAERYDETVRRVAATGAAVEVGTPTEAAARRVDRLTRVRSPWGPDVELVTGLADASEPFDSPLMPGGFRTEGLGFGHLVFQVGTAADFEASHQFAVGALGFTQSDWFEGTTGGPPVVARFYHCNARHHTLALAYSPAGKPPRALNHIMFETVNQDNVGHAFDRAVTTGVPLDAGLGKHDNDRMFSFYLVTPGGFRIEVGSGAREITSPWEENRKYDRPSIWGHLPVDRRVAQST